MISPAKPFVISSAAKPRPPSLEPDAALDEDEDPLPFSVELGVAKAFDTGFVVPGLRGDKGGQRAFVALLLDEGAKIIELGDVHGDPEPPVVLVHGARLLALVFDSDAGGRVLRLLEVVDPRGNARPSSGAELTGIDFGAGGFEAEVADGRGFFAYASSREKSAILGGTFELQKLDGKLVAGPLAATGDGASEPRLARRPGGFWLAFVAELGASKERKPPATPADADTAEPQDLVELGPRELRIVPLDVAGNAVGSPSKIRAPSTRPFAFDLVSDSGGGALLLRQENRGGPGADGGAIELYRVRPDGSHAASSLEDERLGAGVPVLLRDPAPKGGSSELWLSAVGVDDATLFAPLVGEKPPALAIDPIVRQKALLAVHRGRFLASQTRGQNVELIQIECK